MKITANAIDAFIAKPPADCLGVLIYGPDTGQVSERAAAIIKKMVDHPEDPFNVTDLNADALKEGSGVLVDALCAISFGVGKKLVRLRDCENSHSKAIAAALEQVPPDIHQYALLVMTSGDLSPGSLRTLAEKLPNIAALPCYVEEGSSLENVVRDSLKQHQLPADSQVVRYIADHVQGDRMMTRQSVNKLALYVGEPRPITMEDAILVIGDSSESAISDVVERVFSGNIANFSRILRKTFSQGIAPIALLRSMQRHSSRLHQVIAAAQKGTPPDEAMKSLKPPVFFKEAPIFKQQVHALMRSNGSMWKIRTTLYEGEKDQKSGQLDPELACERTCLRLAYLCRR